MATASREDLVRGIVSRAMAEGRSALTELEGMDLLDAMGLATPRRLFVRDASEAGRAIDRDGAAGSAVGFPGDKVVVKVVSSAILHKTEVGGVRMARNSPVGVEAAIAEMEARFAGQAVEGYSINEFVPFEPSLGHEIIAGFRLAPDFGPIVSVGFGGIYAEYIAGAFRPGTATILLSPATAGRELIDRELSRNALQAILGGGLRGTGPAIGPGVLSDLAAAFVRAAPMLATAGILEFEVNPFALTGSGPTARLVALDALAKLGSLPAGLALTDSAGGESRIVNPKAEARPLAKIDRLLKPASAAIVGVSGKAVNNGRIILRNMLKNGFDPGANLRRQAGRDRDRRLPMRTRRRLPPREGRPFHHRRARLLRSRRARRPRRVGQGRVGHRHTRRLRGEGRNGGHHRSDDDGPRALARERRLRSRLRRLSPAADPSSSAATASGSSRPRVGTTRSSSPSTSCPGAKARPTRSP